MTKFAFGMIALIVSLVFIGVAVFNADLARDGVLVYLSVAVTFLWLAHMEGRPPDA